MHPVSGRRIPVVVDAELVDPALGTGCVKVTPAHDPNDFACGQRHNLPLVRSMRCRRPPACVTVAHAPPPPRCR